MKLTTNRYMSRRAAMLTLAGALAMSVVFALDWDGRQASAQSLSCGITQVTFTAGGRNEQASISADGTVVAFWSDRNLTGNNADGSAELILYNTVTNSLAQVTHTTEGAVFAQREPAVSADGTRIAFWSINDLTGGNFDRNAELFLYDATTNTITQVTNTIHGLNQGPSINADGTRIAFHSKGDPVADTNTDIFLYHTTTNTFTQITNAIEGSLDPSISGDGTRIGFRSSADLNGNNADVNEEIFLYDTTTNIFTQVTQTTPGPGLGNRLPSFSADGTRIAFVSNHNLTGSNADGNGEIFLYNTITNTITQITNTMTPGEHNEFPSMNGDGTRIAFQANSNLTGGNADGSLEIFLYDTTTSTFTQVSNDTVGAIGPSISDDGTRIAFSSNGFANLGNADGNSEIFLASCRPSFADMFIDQSADQTKVKQGETLTYTLTVGNLGPDAAPDVTVFDELSSGVGFVSAQANKGSFTTPQVGQTGIVTWNLGSMASGERETAQIQVTVSIRGKDTITNNARVISQTSDPDGGNNSSSLTTTVQPGKKK